MDRDDVDSRINKTLREMGLSDNDLVEIEKHALRVREARDAMMKRAREDKGEDFAFVAQQSQVLYAIVTAAAQFSALLPLEQRDRGKHAFDTIVVLTAEVLSDLQKKLNLSDDDMMEIQEMSSTVVQTVLDNAKSFVPEAERKAA